MIESSDSFAGFCGISGIQGTDQAEFDWYLRSDQWGRGYATEATMLLLSFGFRSLGRRRMYATADPDNLAPVRVLEKTGLTCDGSMGLVETWRGPRPRLLFSISDTDWFIVGPVGRRQPNLIDSTRPTTRAANDVRFPANGGLLRKC